MAHGVGVGKMFTGGRRGVARSCLVARRGRGVDEVGCRRELDLAAMVEGRLDGWN
jgi:hypothetical protein